MIKIESNVAYEKFEKIFGDDVLMRYEWFLNAFGMKAAKMFHKHFLESIKTLPGGREYKRRLVLAEIRDKKKMYWFVLAALNKRFSDCQYPADESIFRVVPRYEGIHDDPVSEILEHYGPWTVDTIPFLPSVRQGQVVLVSATPKEVKATQRQNEKDAPAIKSAMVRLSVTFEQRDNVYSELKVIPDLEVEAIAWEFGVRKGGKPHWRPSLRWLKTIGVKRLEKDSDLRAIFTNANFRKYRLRKKLQVKFNIENLKALNDFQNKVRA